MRVLARRLIVLALLLAPGVAAAQSSEQQRLVERARLTVEEFLADPRFEDVRAYMQNAYGVLIVPDLLRAGFFVGAEYGVGVLLGRDTQTGEWGPPAFYNLAGGSLGLQFGGTSSDVLFTIMNRDALSKLLANRIKLGADASVAAGTLGAGVGAGTTTSFGEDVYVFAKAKGLYGGMALDGSLLIPKDDWNQAYYGRVVSPEEIVFGNRVDNPGADELQRLLNEF